VHLADWPLVDELPSDPRWSRRWTACGRCARPRSRCAPTNKLRVRLPLPSSASRRRTRAARAFADVDPRRGQREGGRADRGRAAHGRFEVAVNARAAGPRLGKDVQTAIKAARPGMDHHARWAVYAAGIELLEHEYERRLVSRDPGAAAELPTARARRAGHDRDPELTAEGIARDVVRVVQQARRDAGLDVSDRIALTLQAPEAVVAASRTHEAFIAGETLSVDVAYGEVTDGFEGTVGEGIEIVVGVTGRGAGDDRQMAGVRIDRGRRAADGHPHQVVGEERDPAG
jgi:isoleucyl-tRNA synthetase